MTSLKAKPGLKPTVSRVVPAKTHNQKALINFPIVGIGASAGGLAAYEAFFSAMPSTTEGGLAIVIVQHLSPDHKSILCELIKRYTPMAVHEVTDGITVERNSAYIIPPNKDMAFINGKLLLLEPVAQRGHRLPIDSFFRSLADDQQERAICIILSGTGSDGTLGARAIKGGGGLVIAQKPETTEYDGMPQSIISNGLADYVLAPEEIPAVLITYTTHSTNLKPIAESAQIKYIDYLNKMFVLIRTRTGHDFSNYKPKTILRRLERRMVINQIDSLANYFMYLQNNAMEVDALFHDFLIGVTSFFRDIAAFEALQERALPLLFADKTAGSTVRVWIPACSTGEEAYSIAIILFEYADKLGKDFRLQIFATDIDHLAVEQARMGIYSTNIATDVTAERLKRFFSLNADKNTYQIRKSIRELIVFSEQDIIKEPPFSKVDMISCRNLLIYLNPDLHKKLVPVFHYALNEKGILFLGTAESCGEYTDLFSPVLKNHKIYQRLGEASNRPQITIHLTRPEYLDYRPDKKTIAPEQKQASFRELAEAELLRLYAPAAVIVNAEGDILYFHGRTGKYLEPAPGDAEAKLIKMARQGLQKELSHALHKVATYKKEIHCPKLKVKTNGDFTTINLTVKPLMLNPDRMPMIEGELFIVIFEETADVVLEQATVIPLRKKGKANAGFLKTIADMELEIRSKDEYIQTTVEEMETSTEEMKSTNEEMQSVNEELQSTNEELETSREELQSVNEELATVNAELQTKIQYLSKAEDDLNNLLASTGVGTIFVDLQQIIQRFTPAVVKIIKLIKSDVGRPVSDIVTHLISYSSLSEDIQTVLDTLIPIEKQVQIKDEVWLLMRIMPYRTLDNVIDGAVITFTDITLHKKAELVLHEYETLKRLTAVVKDAYDAVIMQDLTGSILAWNPAAVRMYGFTEAEALGMNTFDIMPEKLRKVTQGIFNNLNSLPLKPFNTERICKDGNIVPILVTTTALINAEGVVYAIATTEKSRV
jgi:two-component system CheB/CheR fusion protein